MADNWKTYLFEYYHDGASWSLEICAPSYEDAVERLKKLPLARYSGTLEMAIPAYVPSSGLLVRLLCWFRNRLVGHKQY